MRVDITVVRPKGRDSNGELQTGDTRFPVRGCIAYPRTGGPGTASRDINTRGREGVVEGLTIWAPFDADIRHTDAVIMPAPFGTPDELWEVDGEVGRWANPFSGKSRGCEVAVRRAAG